MKNKKKLGNILYYSSLPFAFIGGSIIIYNMWLGIGILVISSSLLIPGVIIKNTKIVKKQ